MFFGVVVMVTRSRSLEFDLVALGIGCLAGAIAGGGSQLFQRSSTESFDDVNPLNTDFRSNLKRTYRAAAKLNFPLYFALALGVLGVVLLVIAGILKLFG